MPNVCEKLRKPCRSLAIAYNIVFFIVTSVTGKKKRLIERVSKIINKEEDQIIIIPITEKQLKEIESIGIKEDMRHHGIIIV
jgi:CRISPR-associated protein Cas2